MSPKRSASLRAALVATLAASLSLSFSAAAVAQDPAPTKKAAGSASVGTKGATATGSSSGGKDNGLPEVVYGGNAVSLQLPPQVGLVGYAPRARLGLTYDRQIVKAHWISIGIAGVFDRGKYTTFRVPCGSRDNMTAGDFCNPGTVSGLDANLAYVHRFYLKKRPWLVPAIRVGVGGGFWNYPDKGNPQQDRISSWTLNGRVGGGLRFFPLPFLGVGLDVEVHPGFVVHDTNPIAPVTAKKTTEFFLPLNLPITAELRF